MSCLELATISSLLAPSVLSLSRSFVSFWLVLLMASLLGLFYTSLFRVCWVHLLACLLPVELSSFLRGHLIILSRSLYFSLFSLVSLLSLRFSPLPFILFLSLISSTIVLSLPRRTCVGDCLREAAVPFFAHGVLAPLCHGWSKSKFNPREHATHKAESPRTRQARGKRSEE